MKYVLNDEVFDIQRFVNNLGDSIYFDFSELEDELCIGLNYNKTRLMKRKDKEPAFFNLIKRLHCVKEVTYDDCINQVLITKRPAFDWSDILFELCAISVYDKKGTIPGDVGSISNHKVTHTHLKALIKIDGLAVEFNTNFCTNDFPSVVSNECFIDELKKIECVSDVQILD